jgi:tetratricopeptide (TPR) repeat protein
VGNALERLHADQADKIAVQLARHFQAAGIVIKAIDYLLQAGERAARLSAYHEAISHFQQGLALLPNLPNQPGWAQRELALQISLGNALTATEGYAALEVGQAYTRARELCHELGETPQLVPVLNGLGGYFLNRGEARNALELEEQVIDLAKKWPIAPGLLAQAHHVLGATLWFMGEFAVAQLHFEKGIALATLKEFQLLLLNTGTLGSSVHYGLGLMVLTGYPDQALKRIDEMLTWSGSRRIRSAVPPPLVLQLIPSIPPRGRHCPEVCERVTASSFNTTFRSVSNGKILRLGAGRTGL